MATIKQLLVQGESALPESDSARLDAEILLASATRQSRTWLYTWPEHIPTVAEQHLYLDLVRRRRAGEPVAYLIGRREFWGLELKVNPHVLIPRPETEVLVEAVLKTLAQVEQAKIADLGTGSGAIALALAHEKPDWELTATDSSDEALELAEENARLHGIKNISFCRGDWLRALDGKMFTALVSNPPYIRADDEHLEQGDVRFEPVHALVSADDGLADIKLIATQSGAHLEHGGWLFVEHGYQQGEDVRRIFAESGFNAVETIRDLAGHERVTKGSRQPPASSGQKKQ